MQSGYPIYRMLAVVGVGGCPADHRWFTQQVVAGKMDLVCPSGCDDNTAKTRMCRCHPRITAIKQYMVDNSQATPSTAAKYLYGSSDYF